VICGTCPVTLQDATLDVWQDRLYAIEDGCQEGRAFRSLGEQYPDVNGTQGL
jgi:hypothetical protein